MFNRDESCRKCNQILKGFCPGGSVPCQPNEDVESGSTWHQANGFHRTQLLRHGVYRTAKEREKHMTEKGEDLGVEALNPKSIVEKWVRAFNKADAETLVSFYTEDAVNHQVAWDPIEGKEAIQRMFQREFARAKMTCIVENLFEDGEWAILEWRDPLGLRGCGFFHVTDGKIQFQRGYWDQLSFLRQQGLPLPTE